MMRSTLVMMLVSTVGLSGVVGDVVPPGADDAGDVPGSASLEIRPIDPAAYGYGPEDDLYNDLLGRPEGPFPRPLPPIAIPAMAGPQTEGVAPVMFFVFITNVGTQDFDGERVIGLPDVGIEERVPVRLGGNSLQNAGQSDGFLLILDLPEPVPDEVRLTVHHEQGGQVVGESIDATTAVYKTDPCADRPAAVFTSGQKRVRLSTWDAPMFSLTFCNHSVEARTVGLLATDAATGRPLVDPTATVSAAVLTALGFDAEHPHLTTPQAIHIPPGTSVALAYKIDAVPLTQDLTPEFTLVHDGGAIETFEGDTITYGGESLPRPPALPL